jgi:hypothetical protein
MTSQAPRQSMETHSAHPQVEARRPRGISTPRTVTLRQREPGGGVSVDNSWLSMQPASKHDFLQTPRPKPQAPELKCQLEPCEANSDEFHSCDVCEELFHNTCLRLHRRTHRAAESGAKAGQSPPSRRTSARLAASSRKLSDRQLASCKHLPGRARGSRVLG